MAELSANFFTLSFFNFFIFFMSNTNPARGMRDFLPAAIRRREYVINIIKSVYESYGFEPLETPAVENIETLTGKYGEEGNQLIYKILKRGEGAATGEADLALRYDLTVPLARVVANHKNDLPKFFKRYQIQPVWRADRPARGRYREFYQCDADAIGSSSMIVEAELCAAVSEILEKLGFDDFVIRVNHREILRGILNAAEILAEKYTEALVAIDKLDKITREGVENEFRFKGINDESGLRVLDVLDNINNLTVGFEKQPLREMNNFFNSLNLRKDLVTSMMQSKFPKKIDYVRVLNGIIISNLKEFVKEETNAISALKDLNVFLVTSSNKFSEKIRIDPSLARGLSYYTGAIFEINVPDLAGSLGGGGRYDGLIGMFGKEQIPACGFSLGLERIIVVMEERGMFPPELQNNSADVLVTIWNEDAIGESLKLANDLRAEGLRVLVYPEVDKLGKQFKYADSIGVKYVCVLGESEIAENKAALKNMQTGEQETVAREEIAGKIKQ